MYPNVEESGRICGGGWWEYGKNKMGQVKISVKMGGLVVGMDSIGHTNCSCAVCLSMAQWLHGSAFPTIPELASHLPAFVKFVWTKLHDFHHIQLFYRSPLVNLLWTSGIRNHIFNHLEIPTFLPTATILSHSFPCTSRPVLSAHTQIHDHSYNLSITQAYYEPSHYQWPCVQQ